MIFSITLLKVLMISLVYSNYRERLFSFISKFRYQKGITPQQKSRKVRYLCGFPAPCLLFKLANKILLLYFLVLVLWFYLVLYVFNCPKSIGCTERCYQIVIMIVLSIIFSLKRLKQLLAIHLTLQQSVLE